MTMRELAFLAAAAMITVSCGQRADEATTGEAVTVEETVMTESYSLDSGAVVEWRGYKVYIDDQHLGNVPVSGAFELAEGNLVGGVFTMDMTAITVTDMEGEMKTKLEGHLSNADFFDVATYPTAVFTIASVAPLTDVEGVNSTVTGNLEIKGITNSISFNAMVTADETAIHFEAPVFSIDRNKWGVVYNNGEGMDLSGKAKNYVIDKSIEFKLNLKATI